MVSKKCKFFINCNIIIELKKLIYFLLFKKKLAANQFNSLKT